jgi:hypothetical protein
MTNAETATTANPAVVPDQGANVAPEKASSKKGATQKKNAPKAQKGAKGAKPKREAKVAKKATAQPAPQPGNKKAEVIAMMKRAKGATLAEIMEATGWQKHYADVRIMPTCVGNPACGAGIAAMESA